MNIFEKTLEAIVAVEKIIDKAKSYNDITKEIDIDFDEDPEQIDFSYLIDDEYILQGVIKRRYNNFFYIERGALFEVWKDNGCTPCFVMTINEIRHQIDRLFSLDI